MPRPSRSSRRSAIHNSTPNTIKQVATSHVRPPRSPVVATTSKPRIPVGTAVTASRQDVRASPVGAVPTPERNQPHPARRYRTTSDRK